MIIHLEDMKMLDKTLLFVVYLRKSLDRKDRQVLSIAAQKREILEFAKKHGIKIVKIFVETQSAYKTGRPVFAEMMDFIEEGFANAVLVWKPDRIARNAEDAGRFIQAIDDGKILELRTPFEQFRKEDNRLMLYMHFGMSNDYSRQISANVKRGNREKYNRGEFLGKAPLGYLNDTEVKGAIKLDPKETAYVGDTEHDMETGEKASLYTIASTYGYRTKSQLEWIGADYYIDDISELKDVILA